MDEALGKPHQDAVLALVDSWAKQAQASDILSADDVLISEDADSTVDTALQKHMPEEAMDLG